MKKIWFPIGIGLLGLTVGYISGLSSNDGISGVLLTSIFTLSSGFAIWKVLEQNDKLIYYIGIVISVLFFNILIGINVGILVKTNMLLIPEEKKNSVDNQWLDVLKSDRIKVDTLQLKLDKYYEGEINCEEFILWLENQRN